MNDEIKECISVFINLLKTEMKKDGIIFGIMVDKNDANNSKLAFINKERYEKTGLAEGFSISITDLNEGLM